MSKDNTLLILGLAGVGLYLWSRNNSASVPAVYTTPQMPANVTNTGQKSILLPLVNAINPNSVNSLLNSIFNKSGTPAAQPGTANPSGFSSEAQSLFNTPSFNNSLPSYTTPSSSPSTDGGTAANFSNEAGSVFNIPSFSTLVNSYTDPSNNSSFASNSPTGVDLTDQFG